MNYVEHKKTLLTSSII